MKILFIGTVKSSQIMLSKLISINAEIVAVITKESSPYNADYADLTPLCIEHGIPYRYTKNINSSEDIKWMKSFSPDIIFCFGFSALLKDEVLNLAPKGVIGFHPAHLPKNRGRHPIIWALALGLKETGVSFFFMDEGADSGDLLSQEVIPIAYEDDAKTLYNKIMDSALGQIEVFLPALTKDINQRIVQDHSLANYWRKRGKEDGKIDFRMSSYSIFNLVRALTRPYLGAHLVYDGKEIIVWKVEEILCDSINFEPGKILRVTDEWIEVKCGEGAVRLLEHTFDELPKEEEYCL